MGLFISTRRHLRELDKLDQERYLANKGREEAEEKLAKTEAKGKKLMLDNAVLSGKLSAKERELLQVKAEAAYLKVELDRARNIKRISAQVALGKYDGKHVPENFIRHQLAGELVDKLSASGLIEVTHIDDEQHNTRTFEAAIYAGKA